MFFATNQPPRTDSITLAGTTAKTASLLMRLRASLRKALISEGISI